MARTKQAKSRGQAGKLLPRRRQTRNPSGQIQKLVQQDARLRRQEAATLTLRDELGRLERGGTARPTGTGSVYMNYSDYYMSYSNYYPAARSGIAPAARSRRRSLPR